MSLGMAVGKFTEGYIPEDRYQKQQAAAAEGEQYRRGMMERGMAMKEEQAQGDAELRKAKMDQIKDTMRKENFKEALQHMLVGDMSGAEAAYNKSGDRRMKAGSAKVIKDPEDGTPMITWIDEESGQPVYTDMRFAMLATGTKPKDLETPEEAHKRAMELEKAKNRGSKVPASLQVYQHILDNLKKSDGSKYTPEEAWAEANRSKESRLAMVSKMVGSIMQSQPGTTAEEARLQAEQVFNKLEETYGGPRGSKAGESGIPIKGQGAAAEFMPTEDQLAGQQQPAPAPATGGMAGRDTGPVMGDLYADEEGL